MLATNVLKPEDKHLCLNILLFSHHEIMKVVVYSFSPFVKKEVMHLISLFPLACRPEGPQTQGL